ncbi:hypothetical protein EG19_06480 [Thermoanaerobaculum aquaticum]|uniref:Uncharacterized protein n=1 Tax=Thermoanaerobaculum aquaticum TaxID=1312852 RepID=A0A062XLJ3_9BACT|nr:hypothetical protein EG19_06480 [Thermoanaerobaculum aquaticum]
MTVAFPEQSKEFFTIQRAIVGEDPIPVTERMGVFHLFFSYCCEPNMADKHLPFRFYAYVFIVFTGISTVGFFADFPSFEMSPPRYTPPIRVLGSVVAKLA